MNEHEIYEIIFFYFRFVYEYFLCFVTDFFNDIYLYINVHLIEMNNSTDCLDQETSKRIDRSRVYSDIDGIFDCTLIKVR
jgi:hypothetical protein